MESRQISLTLSSALLREAETYAKNFGFRSTQELITEAVREKVMEKDFDEDFTEEEIKLVDDLIKTCIQRKDFATRAELMKALG
jgi:metal-responsive CopG/Arc/MetJ family transcriptional regulator